MAVGGGLLGGETAAMNTRRHDDLLLNLYACPSDRARWPTLLDRVCHATHARSAVIQLLVSDGERTWSRYTLRDSASEAVRAEHERYMGDDVNPRLRAPLSPKPHQYAFRDRDFFAPGDPALQDLEERLAAVQLGRFLSVGEPLPGNVRLALVLHRDRRNRREFDSDEERFALSLVPHLRQAIQLAEQFDETQQRVADFESALDRVRCALILCDADARVLWANCSAETHLARGKRLRVRSERLIATSARETAALRRKIALVARSSERAPLSERYMAFGQSGPGAPLQVMMHPLVPDGAVGGGGSNAPRRVLLTLSSPDHPPSLPAQLIGQVFALSPAESRVAAALCNGLTINEYASANGVTIGTARFQMKQVLAKTQAPRQADLVRQICSSVIAHVMPTV